MSYQALFVDRFPVDTELQDPGTLGPEGAHLAQVYLETPRALIWQNASPEWPLLILLLPMASRLSLMENPIFSALVRDWGLNVGFIGIDQEQRVFDFRQLLSDDILRKLVRALSDNLGHKRGLSNEQTANPTLDLLFSALADGMLTMLEQRRSDYPNHLARQCRLEAGIPGSLFDRESRFADFLRALRAALKQGVLDMECYGRALRSIDLREEAVEQRISSLIQAGLSSPLLDRLQRAGVGMHLGCYNWLASDPLRVRQREYVLQRASCFAQYLVDQLLPRVDDDLLSRVIDSGQDRLILETLAARFSVSANTLRQLWRLGPTALGLQALGTPTPRHLQQILSRLDAIAIRDWPQNSREWFEFKRACAAGLY